MLTTTKRLFLLKLAAFPLTAGVLCAQTPGTGAITGKVQDPSGLAVANAAILATNESTDATRSAVTSSTGVFAMTLLSPGTYSLTVTVAGFEVNTPQSVRVVVGETGSLQFKLAMQRAGVTVEVEAEAEMAQSQSSTLGRAAQDEAIQALPLENRNYTQILSLSPGVAVGLPNATTLGRGSQNVTANGSKTTATNIQFNGVDANNLAQDSVENATEEVGVAIPAPVDMAIERTFPMEGAGNLRFRTEFFNVTNVANFTNPDRTVNDGAAFGTISSASNNPRIIQFALKYAF